MSVCWGTDHCFRDSVLPFAYGALCTRSMLDQLGAGAPFVGAGRVGWRARNVWYSPDLTSDAGERLGGQRCWRQRMVKLNCCGDALPACSSARYVSPYTSASPFDADPGACDVGLRRCGRSMSISLTLEGYRGSRASMIRWWAFAASDTPVRLALGGAATPFQLATADAGDDLRAARFVTAHGTALRAGLCLCRLGHPVRAAAPALARGHRCERGVDWVVGGGATQRNWPAASVVVESRCGPNPARMGKLMDVNGEAWLNFASPPGSYRGRTAAPTP